MSEACSLLLTLALSLPATEPAAPAPELPRLREMLYNRQSFVQQCSAAYLVVHSRDEEAAAVIRQGLRQTDSAEVFVVLAAALRAARDGRFGDELLAALSDPRANVRQAAAETLAVVATDDVIPR